MKRRILPQNSLRTVPGRIEYKSVLGQRSDVETYRQTALLSSLQVARPPHLHILLRQLETVFCSAHQLDPVLRLLAHLVSCHQHAVRLLAATSYTATQLMKLTEPESFSAFNHHHRCVRHIYAHLYHGSRHKNVRPASCESIHVEFLDIVLLLAMHDSSLVVREREVLDDVLGSSFKTLIVKFLCLVDQRIYHKNLTSQRNLVLHELIECRPFTFGRMNRLHRLSSRRKFVDHGHIEVSVQSHGESARNRRRRHHKHMRRRSTN